MDLMKEYERTARVYWYRWGLASIPRPIGVEAIKQPDTEYVRELFKRDLKAINNVMIYEDLYRWHGIK